MRKMSFVGGQVLLLNGVRIVLKTSQFVNQEEVWEVFNESSRFHETISRYELDEALRVGTLLVPDDDPVPGAAQERKFKGTRLISDLPPKRRQRIYFERKIIQEVERRTLRGMKTTKVVVNGARTKQTVLGQLLQELGREFGPEFLGREVTISPSTYYSWRKKHRREVAPDRIAGGYDRRGRRDQLGPGIRQLVLRVIREKLDEGKGKKVRPGEARIAKSEIQAAVVTAIDHERDRRPGEDLRIPSDSTFDRYLKTFDAYDVDLVLKGQVRVNHDYRGPLGKKKPDFPLARCEFDETRVPLFLVHQALGIPLGRPWLAWLADVYTGGVVGFYLGFEPPGDLVFAQTLRHACLPKTYINSRYPGIMTPYLHAGLPKLITLDNSMQAHGNSVQAICGDLDILYDFQPPRMPWIKPTVENLFKKVELSLLRSKPGYAVPRDWKIDSTDYDPETTAVIGFETFVALLHAWIADYLHTRRPSRGNKPSPNQLWLEGVERVKPEFIGNSADLGALFGIIREASRLDHHGVVFEGIRYYSSNASDVRRALGAVTYVDIKVNPLDLRTAYIRCADGSWLPVRTDEHALVEGLDLHLLTLLGKQSRALFGRDTLEDRVRAIPRLEKLVKAGYEDDISIANAWRAARAMGIGTHKMFAQLGHDGQARQPGLASGSPAQPNSNPPQVGTTAVAPKEIRPASALIPQFSVDHSLGRKS